VKTTVYLSWGERIPVDDLIDGATLEKYEWLAPDGKVKPLATTGVSLQTNVEELRDVGLHEIVFRSSRCRPFRMKARLSFDPSSRWRRVASSTACGRCRRTCL
jgi:hypothetical protein